MSATERIEGAIDELLRTPSDQGEGYIEVTAAT